MAFRHRCNFSVSQQVQNKGTMDDLEFKLEAQQIIYIKIKMTAAHDELAQTSLPITERSLTARNYDSSIIALGQYLEQTGYALPTRNVLEHWREDMLSGKLGRKYAVATINARLSAARKLLRMVADDVTDLTLRMLLEFWSNVTDAKEEKKPKTPFTKPTPYLTHKALTELLNSIETDNIKGIRDRAIIAIIGGAGLSVNEVAELSIRDVFLSKDDDDMRTIHVRHGKFNQERFVLLDSWNSWIIDAAKDYLDALELNTLEDAILPLFRGVKRVLGGYASLNDSLSKRGIQRAVMDYSVKIYDEEFTPTPRDLRRSYAIICLQSGMSWAAVSANMGHSTLATTERLIGEFIDETARPPQWTIELD